MAGDSDDNFFDAIIVGTGLTESILAAALSKAKYKVAHIDPNPYYGGDEASLSQEEVLRWGDTVSAGAQPMFESYSGSSETIPYSRQYSICLRPSVIPALGPLITGLIASGVAKYSGFKLLDSVSIYSKDGSAKNVPGSKEAVFNSKDISLIEKRRLMRFLTFAASEFEEKAEIHGKEKQPFGEFLKATYQLSDDTISVIVYSLAHCVSAGDHTLPALLRLRAYVRGIGRYGPSPFLVGHYGGLGDISQGFCRAAAVSGGVYILGRPISSIGFHSGSSSDSDEQSYVKVTLDDFPEVLKSRVIISSATNPLDDAPLAALQIPLSPAIAETSAISKVARCIAILDTPLRFYSKAPSLAEEEREEGSASSSGGPLDTGLLIVPPKIIPSGSQDTAATVFVNGENSLSTPKGRWIVYIILPLTSTQLGQSAESVLSPYLSAVLSLASTSDGSPPTPLSTSFYFEKQPPTRTSRPHASPDTPRYFVTPPLEYSAFPDLPDAATYNAEAAFQQVVRSLRALKGDPVRDDEELDFWPPLEAEDANSDED